MPYYKTTLYPTTYIFMISNQSGVSYVFTQHLEMVSASNRIFNYEKAMKTDYRNTEDQLLLYLFISETLLSSTGVGSGLLFITIC